MVHDQKHPLLLQNTEFLHEHVDTTEPLIVAVSGGVDSMVLLKLTLDYAWETGVLLRVVHVDHRLRASSTRDREFVEKTCHEWGVPVVVREVDLGSVPSSLRQGPEADARRLRYECIIDVAKSQRSRQVLLAHHADDQVETVLWRLIRGTSSTGLAGIRPVTERSGVRFLRPLLDSDKQQLLDYAMEHNVGYCVDETNDSRRYTRNYLRHDVIPLLKTIQPSLATQVTRLTRLLSEEDEWLESVSRDLVNECAVSDSDGYRIDLTRFLEYPRPLQRRAIKILLYCLATADFTSSHIGDILALANSSNPSGSLALPGNSEAKREYTELVLRRPSKTMQGNLSTHRLRDRMADVVEDTRLEGQELDQDVSFHVIELHPRPDWNVKWAAFEGAGVWRFECRLWEATEDSHFGTAYDLYIPFIPSLRVVPARTSDKMRLLGLNGSKKVQDIFTDAKVLRRLRPEWPAVYVDSELLWLPGLARSDEFLLSPNHRGGFIIHAVMEK